MRAPSMVSLFLPSPYPTQKKNNKTKEKKRKWASRSFPETLETRKQKIDYFGQRYLFNMASTDVFPPLLDRLFQDLTSDFSPKERMDVVKSTKGTLHGKYEHLENEDSLACLRLLAKQGHVSDNRLTLKTLLSIWNMFYSIAPPILSSLMSPKYFSVYYCSGSWMPWILYSKLLLMLLPKYQDQRDLVHKLMKRMLIACTWYKN